MTNGEGLQVFIAGLVGSVVNVSIDRRLTMRMSVAVIIAGTASAFYISPLIAHRIGAGDDMTSALGFITGLIGMNICTFIIRHSGSIVRAGFDKFGISVKPDNKDDT